MPDIPSKTDTSVSKRSLMYSFPGSFLSFSFVCLIEERILLWCVLGYAINQLQLPSSTVPGQVFTESFGNPLSSRCKGDLQRVQGKWFVFYEKEKSKSRFCRVWSKENKMLLRLLQ